MKEMSTEDAVRLLIVDDDEAIRSFFAEIFPEERFIVDCVANGEEAALKLAQSTFDVVVTDLCMPKMDGIRLIQEIQKLDPTTTVVAITGFGTIKDAVSLMKAGAYDVLTKPFSLDEIRLTIDKSIRHHQLSQKNRELRQKLKSTEKLAVIGKLAAGVAHEINNPLDGAIRFVNLTLDRLGEHTDVRDYLLDARDGLNRIARIVRSLLDFSRSIVIEAEPVPLGDLLRDIEVQLQHHAHRGGIRVRYDLEVESVAIPEGYRHVFTNLIKNAMDEMPDGGDLLLQSRQTPEGIDVSCADSGPGIPAAVRDKVFEPFFTTKKMGMGTGLGLSICQQIAERQGGKITFDTREGEGTTFTVTIPVEAARSVGPMPVKRVSSLSFPSAPPPPPAPAASMANGNEQVG